LANTRTWCPSFVFFSEVDFIYDITMAGERQQSNRLTASSQLAAWRFSDRAIAFSGVNAMVGAACWQLYARPVIAVTAFVNSFLCLMGLTFQSEYPALSNGYVCLAACNATAQYALHMAKVPSLRALSVSSALYASWLLACGAFATDRLLWAVALRSDS
jgi:hypothetical protein